jgi:hypothetical protein
MVTILAIFMLVNRFIIHIDLILAIFIYFFSKKKAIDTDFLCLSYL